jgi:hypothetical protein
MSARSAKESLILGLGRLVWLSLSVLLCSFSGWSQQPPMNNTANGALADSQGTQASAAVGSNTLSTKWGASAARLLINPESTLSEPS